MNLFFIANNTILVTPLVGLNYVYFKFADADQTSITSST